jgi:hypothetical protein
MAIREHQASNEEVAECSFFFICGKISGVSVDIPFHKGKNHLLYKDRLLLWNWLGNINKVNNNKGVYYGKNRMVP